MNTILATLAILLPILVTLAVVRPRRPMVEDVAPSPAAPWCRPPVRWYRASNGLYSWTDERRDGRLDRGPFFSPRRAYEIMDARFGSIEQTRVEGESMASLSRFFCNVMCYYPVDDPRLGDDVTVEKIAAGLNRGLELLVDDLSHFRTRSGQRYPDLAHHRAVARLRREANDDGSWLLVSDLLNDIAGGGCSVASWVRQVVYVSRVVYLIQAIGEAGY